MTAVTTHLVLPQIFWLSILPVLVLLGGALLILLASSVTRRPLDTVWITGITFLTGVVALTISLIQYYDVERHGAHVAIAGAVVQDGFSAFVSVLVSSAVCIAALVGDGWLERQEVVGPEFHCLLLVSASGAVVMGLANDLIVVFLGLEILSIALYVLAAFNSRRAQSGEAGLKYFILGGFSSAIFLYGIALVYGSTGSTNLPQVADYLARNVLLHNGLLLGGLTLLLVGFAFKVAAVPFHLWTPDVYQGSPSPVTGFMAAVAKAAGFAGLLRVFISTFGSLRADWQPVVWGLAALTLLLGAVVALAQRDIKRMLAYSSINHAGFVLLGVQAADGRGVEAALYYLFVYTFMVLGSFAVITVVGGDHDNHHNLERYRGLVSRQPWLAGSLTVLLLAQAGIPFTTGLWAKLEVIDAAVNAHSVWLAVIAMVSAVIAAFFYLRVVLLMFAPARGAAAPAADGSCADASSSDAPVGDPGAEVAPNPGAAVRAGMAVAVAAPADDELVVPASVASAIAVCVAVTVFFGVFPGWLTAFAHHATLLLR